MANHHRLMLHLCVSQIEMSFDGGIKHTSVEFK